MTEPSANTTYTIGIDIGGTFTDLFLWSSEGQTGTYKVSSTPQDPSVGVMNALSAVAEDKGLELRDLVATIRTIVHGTTVTTNAVLTRNGAATGLLTTQGVRDALEMRRGIRERQYDNRYQNVEPLVPRRLRRPVKGRIDWRGEEVEPLSRDDVAEAVDVMKSAGVEAVAVCFMNAFADSSHERAAAEVLRSQMPDAYLSISSEVLPTIRFYNRVSTTVLNAYTGPVLRRYLRSLIARLDDAGFGGVLLIMQSNGGVALPEIVEGLPATTLLSGPAAGPRAAVAFAEPLGTRSCLLADMGGTSFDASLVAGGDVALQSEGEIDRLRIAMPMLDIATIGAGGGSIGWIDASGLLRMGPQSAGADPGPACYGRGGEQPTCTDANLVLGYLEPSFFAGGRVELSPERARHAIEAHVAKPLGLDLEDAAAGMYRVINVNMAHGLRQITIKRGLDPREFPLVIAGGAGGLHACTIASELEIPTVLVPRTASILCASGMLLTDLQHDLVRSSVGQLDELQTVAVRVDELVAAGSAQLRREGVSEQDEEHRVALDLRYLKQYHEVTVPVEREWIDHGNLDAIAQAFHAAHDALYGYELSEEGTPLELINVRVRSIGHVEQPELPRIEHGDGDASHACKGKRRAFLPHQGAFGQVGVYDGHALRAGDRIDGPALVERTDTTVFVTSEFAVHVDDHGTCVLERKEPSR